MGTLEVMDTFIDLMVVMVPQVYAYVQTHQMVSVVLSINYISIKTVKKLLSTGEPKMQRC